VSITTNVVSSNPVHGEVYAIQHYVLMSVSDLRQVGYSTNKTGCQNITEILLKVALNIIIPNPLKISRLYYSAFTFLY